MARASLRVDDRSLRLFNRLVRNVSMILRRVPTLMRRDAGAARARDYRPTDQLQHRAKVAERTIERIGSMTRGL
jgi:hypothetical protein